MVEKLAKSLLGLNHTQFASFTDSTKISKKEKMLFCVLAADVMVSLKPVKTQNFSELIENIINFCDDPDSDVRMVADESLNRIITSFSEMHILKIQSELHKIIKKNGTARCLRAALSRFGQLSHFIRSNKGKIFTQSLVPSLIEIAKREEEAIHETLASSIENIFKVLGIFTNNNNLKSLLKAFLHNLSSSNPVIRRCSSSCIISLVQHCKKPNVFTLFVLNSLLDCILPVQENTSLDLILGVLGCLRLLLPLLMQIKNDESITGSFGLRKKKDDSLKSLDRVIQVYELCLHYTKNKDHNIVAAALETLCQILQNPTQQMKSLFLSPMGFSKSNIHSSKENKLWNKSGSELSLASSIPLPENELFDDISLAVGSPLNQHDYQSLTKFNTTDNYGCIEQEIDVLLNFERSYKDKDTGKEINVEEDKENDSDTESLVSELNMSTKFLLRRETEEKESEKFVEYSRSSSQDNLYFPCPTESFNEEEVSLDVGTFTDIAVPLIYCARHLVSSFLLDGSPSSLKSDRAVRISIKSLALSCLSAIVNLYPVIMKMNLFKTINDSPAQEISDILLYSEHSDPQIRGSVNVLIGCFIHSALMEFKGFNCDWLDEENTKLSCKNLISILVKGLRDKSSNCARLTLGAIKSFISTAFQSVYNKEFVPLLYELPLMIENSYWLIKVKLVQVLSDLPYVAIYDVLKSSVYQDEIVDSVLMLLLGDEDSRVRFAAAEAVVRITSLLFNGKSSVLEYIKPFKNDLNKWLKVKNEAASPIDPCIPLLYALTNPEEIGYDLQIESSLSKIVAKLTLALLVPQNKHFLYGYLETLKMLCIQYPTTVYLKGWNCTKMENDEHFLISNLIKTVISLIMTSPDILDLTAFSNATFVMGNLFAGHCVSHLKYNYNSSFNDVEAYKLWNGLHSDELSQIAEEILTHLLKILNLYDGLVQEIPLSNVAESSLSSNAFLPLFSHIKKQEKKLEENEDKKSKNYYNYKQNNQYVKLQKLLKNAHTNYKVSLDSSVGNKFLDLLKSTLYSLSILLEVATVQETGRCAEEMLSYFNSSVTLLPNSTVTCVSQLLKSLFGTNLVSNWEEKLWPVNYQNCNLFDSIFQLPIELFSEKIYRRINFNDFEFKNLTGNYKRVEKKFVIKNTDKNWLATYIKLFEPMVVKSLQLYTVTGNVELQANVLNLLNQLVQLRVNYCLLDENQVFVGFVLKQFELIEQGLICDVEKLLPQIFKFLVLLSYEKHHSKPITSIPNILQLCDGLMASDQSVETHCIPALIPVIEDVFLSKSLISSFEDKELETQREVLLSMLLRLVEFPEVMDILAKVLNKITTIEGQERWKRWSRQVLDAVLPLANQDRLRIETFEGQNSFSNLMFSLSPNVLRPIDPFLKVLFVEPNDYTCYTSLERWLSQVTVFLDILLTVKEDVLLSRLEEISSTINFTSLSSLGNSNSPDPFNIKSFFQVYEPAETMARFIIQVIFVIANKILESFSTSSILQQKLSLFFVRIYHILKSGTFHRTTNSLQNLLAKEENCFKKICLIFKKKLHICPILKCQYLFFLALLNFCDQTYWTEVLQKPKTLPSTLVQWCGVISLSDYLCDNLSDTETLKFLLNNNIQEILILSDEIPVKELLLTIQGRKLEWTLFLEGLDLKEFEKFEPHFVEKLLRLLEISDTVHSANLLVLLIKKFLSSSHLALSLLAGSIACRQVEFLLTLPKEKVLEKINSETFTNLLNFFNNKIYFKRHFNLWGLLNKLQIQLFDSSLIDLSRSHIIQIDAIKDIQLNEDWYFHQVKERCQKRSSGAEVVYLLNFLNYDKILEIMSAPYFNIRLLKDCLLYPITLRQKHEMQDCDNVLYKVFTIDNPLYKAAKFCIIKIVKEVNEIRTSLKKDLNVSEYDISIVETMVLKHFTKNIWDVVPCVTTLLNIIYFENFLLEDEYFEEIIEFGILCIQVMGWLIRKSKKINQRDLENILKCCSVVLRKRMHSEKFSSVLILKTLKIYLDNIYQIISHLIPAHCFYKIQKNEESISEEYEHLNFLYHFVMCKSVDDLLPQYLFNSIRNLIINLFNTPKLSSQILKVPESCEMQDIELLENFIKKFSVIKWSNRQQFEEIWVALLTVLGFDTQENVSKEETGFIVQVNAIAVEGITTLLKNTLLDSDGKTLIHHGRDSLSMKNIYKKLPLVSSSCCKNHFKQRSYHFLDNLEICRRDDKFINGLLSVEYLWTSVKQISSEVSLYEKHSKELSAMGLDLASCIYLLTELYDQWIQQTSVDIKIITSSLRSSLVISDLFTDISQFQWLLNFCFRVDEVIVNEDSVILPLIILGAAKAGAIVLPDKKVCDKIKDLMLRSSDPPCRIAAVEGLLYLLQSYVVCYTVNHTSLPPPGSTFLVDEANFVANVVDTFLPVALEFIQQFKLNQIPMIEDYDRYHWSLIFYLLQHYLLFLGDLKDEFLNYILRSLRNKNLSASLMEILVRGVERLLVTTVIDENFKDQVSKISLELILNTSVIISGHGLQLLMILSFLDKRIKGVRELVIAQEDPEKVMKDMEKINVLFEKLKKSYPKEAEVVGDVISYILMDFTASDVLSKVIQEFLSSHQPHQKILAGLLFKVFERAELNLIEDWVVFSLPSFIQGLPISMSIWTLNCFFVSASNNPWLRSLFPLVQSRMRETEAEDKKLLCLSAANFFKQLKHSSQKKSFIQTFEKATESDSIFFDLLSSLR